MAKFIYPGVYIEEIPASTPFQSVEDTATFIGYTEIHQDFEGKSLCNIPTDISSVTDFENFFGRAQSEENIEIIDLSAAGNLDISVRFNGYSSLHNLYYAIRVFFAQGGTLCKIVSVGTFKDLGQPFSASDLITGLDSLKSEENNLLIAIPENQNISEPDFYLLQQKLLDFCKNQRSFAILDVPKMSETDYSSVIATYRERLNPNSLPFGAAFFPNLITVLNYFYDESTVQIKIIGHSFSLFSIKQSDPALYKKYSDLLQRFFISLPPSSAVTGVIVKNDVNQAIWKSPSLIATAGITAPQININTQQQDVLNSDNSGKSINCLRKFVGKGTLIWGTKTLSGSNTEFRYIMIRRLVNMIESTVQQSLKTVIFSTNSPKTWAKVKTLTSNYLLSLWKLGAMSGNKPEQAFFVNCGLNETMTASDIDSGNLILQIGIATVRPSEFIILKIPLKITD